MKKFYVAINIIIAHDDQRRRVTKVLFWVRLICWGANALVWSRTIPNCVSTRISSSLSATWPSGIARRLHILRDGFDSLLKPIAFVIPYCMRRVAADSKRSRSLRSLHQFLFSVSKCTVTSLKMPLHRVVRPLVYLCYFGEGVMHRPVSSVAKRTLSVLEVWGSIPKPVKSALTRDRRGASRSCVHQALSRGDRSRYSLHVWV